MAIRLDSRALSVMVHDLRNPLNVIGLSLRMIEEELPAAGCDEAREDLRIVRENVALMTRMLSFVGDYARVVDLSASGLTPGPWSPERLAAEVIDEAGAASGRSDRSIALEVGPGCPKVVNVDPIRARVALRYAVGNAVASSANSPVRIVLGGAPDSLTIEVAVDRPPKSTAHSADLAGDSFERLIGNEAERRGLDLALAAGISDLIGGSARIDVRDGVGSSIVLTWPVGG